MFCTSSPYCKQSLSTENDWMWNWFPVVSGNCEIVDISGGWKGRQLCLCVYETNWEGCIIERMMETEKVRNLSNPPVPSILATPENHCMRPALKRTLGQRGLQQWLCFIRGLWVCDFCLQATSYDWTLFNDRFDFQLYKHLPSLKSNRFPELFHSFTTFFTGFLWHSQPWALRNKPI